MTEAIANFHFLRPMWLLATIPLVIVWWQLYRGLDPKRGLVDDIAPHLLDRLVTSPSDRPRIRPVTLLLPIWLVGAIAVAGPSFRQIPSPFASDQSQLLLVIKMTPSMLTTDLQPSRLERCRTKLRDLLDDRAGAPVALIAYSGSAHLVMPSTDDSEVINHMLEALDPKIMPVEGDALNEALAVATKQLEKQQKAGSILVVADSVEASQLSKLSQWRENESTSVQFLAPLRDAASIGQSGLPAAAEKLSATVQQITPDETDIKAISRRADRAIVATERDDATRWRDDGYLLIPFLAIGILAWCRRGWSISPQ